METISSPHEQHCPVLLHHCPLKHDAFFPPMVTDDVPLLSRDLDSSSAPTSSDTDDEDCSWAFDLDGYSGVESSQTMEVPLSPLTEDTQDAAGFEASLAMGDDLFGTADTPPTDYEGWDFGKPRDIFPDTKASRKASTSEKPGMAPLSEDDQQNEASSDEDEAPLDHTSPDKVDSEDTSRTEDLPHQHGCPATSRESSPGENSIHPEDPSKSPADDISPTNTISPVRRADKDSCGRAMMASNDDNFVCSMLKSSPLLPASTSTAISSASKKRSLPDDSCQEILSKRVRLEKAWTEELGSEEAWSEIYVRLYKLILRWGGVVTWNNRCKSWQYENDFGSSQRILEEDIDVWSDMFAAQVRPCGCGYDIWVAYNMESGMYEGLDHMDGKWLLIDRSTMKLLVQEPASSQYIE